MSSDSSAMIRATKLTKFYGSFGAVEDVSFEIRKGETVGFLGPNGAGKSTTMKMLTGFIPPSSGTATIGGFDVVEESLRVDDRRLNVEEHARFQFRVVFSTQNRMFM